MPENPDLPRRDPADTFARAGGRRYGKTVAQEALLAVHLRIQEALKVGVEPARLRALTAGLEPTPASPPQPPPEESLCGEEEDLAAGNVDDEPMNPAALPAQLRAWSQHVRGVARNRQRAYAEALSLAEMQFRAWATAFPIAYNRAMAEQGAPPLNAREAQMLEYFAAGYAEFLREVTQIARNGG